MSDKLKRLDALIRLLGSDNPGEVVATVEAIKRTLEGAGMDLHALASALTLAATQPTPQAAPPPSRNPAQDITHWRAQVRYLLANFDDFTEWEEGFLSTLTKWRVLTDKQQAVLDRLWEEKTGVEAAWDDI